MKVFINKRTGGYSGGMVIVAANNVDEADIVEVKNYYYDEDSWVELLGVTADYEIPTFIAEDGYSE